MKNSECKVTIETSNPTQALLNVADVLESRSPYLREYAAEIVRSNGFDVHVGGRHVAILSGNDRLAIVTSASRDWN